MPASPSLLYLETTLDPTCHRCGGPVDPGVLFCTHCGAPQIRVAIEPKAEPDRLAPPPASVNREGMAGPRASLSLQRASTGRATFLGGLLEGALAMFGLWFIGIPLGAFFSVASYRRNSGGAELNPALGARLGLISGAIGFVIFALAGSLELLLSRGGSNLRDEVMKQLEQMAAQYPGQGQQVLDYLKSAQGWGVIVALSTIFTLIMFLLLSTIGGAVGGAVLSKKDRPKL